MSCIIGAADRPSEELLCLAWKEEVKQDYLEGLIQYESDLQASLYYHLRRLSTGSRVHSIVHKEENFNHREPDVIIVAPDGVKVDFVLELKCNPWNRIECMTNYPQDLEKLVGWEQKARTQDFGLRPYFDPVGIQYNDDRKTIYVTDKTRFGFAAIFKDSDLVGKIKKLPRPRQFWLLWANSGEGQEVGFNIDIMLTS